MEEKMVTYVKGNSMFPTYCEGDILVVDKCVKKYKIGDIVVYNDKGNQIVHRIINIIDDHFFVLKGDNNQEVDRLVRKYEILGKVEKMMRI